jgi:hypothetical protein
MSAPANCFDRYGLQIVEGPIAREPSPGPSEGVDPSRLSGLRPFHWSLLAGFAVVQLAYLGGWALFARWAVRQWIGA